MGWNNKNNFLLETRHGERQQFYFHTCRREERQRGSGVKRPHHHRQIRWTGNTEETSWNTQDTEIQFEPAQQRYLSQKTFYQLSSSACIQLSSASPWAHVVKKAGKRTVPLYGRRPRLTPLFFSKMRNRNRASMKPKNVSLCIGLWSLFPWAKGSVGVETHCSLPKRRFKVYSEQQQKKKKVLMFKWFVTHWCFCIFLPTYKKKIAQTVMLRLDIFPFSTRNTK